MIFFKNFFEKRIPIAEPEDLTGQEAEKPAEIKKEPTRRESLSPPPRTVEEEVLETRERSSSKPLEGGANRKSLIEFKDDGAGVFKPKNGEAKNLREGMEQGTYYKRERAAYLVDRFLGFDLVPPTVIREIDGEEGSVQQFVFDAIVAYDIFQELHSDKYRKDLTKMWLFDYIIWNSDRHSGNLLIKDGKIIAIDHGCAFVYGDDSRIFDSYLTRKHIILPVPSDTAEKIQEFLSWPEGIKILEDLLEELLSKKEAKACIARIKKLGLMLKEGKIEREADLEFNPK